MPWFWDLMQLSTEIPLPVSRTLLKQSHNYVFHSMSTSTPGVQEWTAARTTSTLLKWQRELLPLRDRQQGPSTSQSGPYLTDGAEKIQWISLLPL